jgi:hypothetical protein
MSVAYTVKDERWPVTGGRVRVEGITVTAFKENPGTEGEECECWRLAKNNFKFGKGLDIVSSTAAAKAGELISGPLERMKLRVEQLLKEYKPPEHKVESLELTWKGGLWRMALEAALGVQYLHHHRYERHASARKEPSTY